MIPHVTPCWVSLRPKIVRKNCFRHTFFQSHRDVIGTVQKKAQAAHFLEQTSYLQRQTHVDLTLSRVKKGLQKQNGT